MKKILPTLKNVDVKNLNPDIVHNLLEMLNSLKQGKTVALDFNKMDCQDLLEIENGEFRYYKYDKSDQEHFTRIGRTVLVDEMFALLLRQAKLKSAYAQNTLNALVLELQELQKPASKNTTRNFDLATK